MRSTDTTRAFFATIDLAVNVLTLLVQLFLTGRIVRSLGVGQMLVTGRPTLSDFSRDLRGVGRLLGLRLRGGSRRLYIVAEALLYSISHHQPRANGVGTDAVLGVFAGQRLSKISPRA